MRITYTPKGTPMVNGMFIKQTPYKDLPTMTNIEILRTWSTHMIFRDLATRLWYSTSYPSNISWKNFFPKPHALVEVYTQTYFLNNKRCVSLMRVPTDEII